MSNSKGNHSSTAFLLIILIIAVIVATVVIVNQNKNKTEQTNTTNANSTQSSGSNTNSTNTTNNAENTTSENNKNTNSSNQNNANNPTNNTANNAVAAKENSTNNTQQPTNNTKQQTNNSNTEQSNTALKKATIYVGTINNFKTYQVDISNELSVEDQAQALINEIGFKLGYQIMIKDVSSGKGGMTINFDPDSAPFDLKNTYRGNGTEEYKTNGINETANTIFDSIKETLQKYFGSTMPVYLIKNDGDIVIESANPQIKIDHTKPYTGSK